jgi:hypothetical protein
VTAASVAILGLSVKIAFLCDEYLLLNDVTDARADIERLRVEVNGITNLFELLQAVQRSDGQPLVLSAFQRPDGPLHECLSLLSQLRTRLDGPETTGRFEARSFK